MFTLGELAEAIGGTVKGDPVTVVSGFCSIDHPRSGCITFVEKPREAGRLDGAPIAAVVTNDGLATAFPTAIIVGNPKLAFAEIVRRFVPAQPHVAGIHPSAVVASGAKIDSTASVGACVVIEGGAIVGARTVIGPSAVVGAHSSVGEDCQIGPNVSVYDWVRIGNRVVVNGGTVIGGLGFGFVTTREKHVRFPQVGAVVIEDDVEIGSNCCIDRAALDDTVIHRGTKIDNLVQVAHGVQVGEHTIIAAQTGISGGTRIGKWCVVGGQAGFQGHITVGDQTVVAGGSAVFSDLPEKSKVSGYPAKPHAQSLKVLALTFRLPELLDRLRSMEIELEMMRGELRGLREQRRSPGDDIPEGLA